MGADIFMYVQKKDAKGWKDITLYKNDDKEVEIWRRGWEVVDYLKEFFLMGVTEEEKVQFAINRGWYDDEYDEDAPLYAISYAKVKYLALFDFKQIDRNTKEEANDLHRFWFNLQTDVRAFLSFADEDWVDEDNIRILAFCSY